MAPIPGMAAGLAFSAILAGGPESQPQDTLPRQSLRIREVVLQSTALGGAGRYVAVLPEAARANSAHRRIPVVVLLHGAGRNCRTLVEDPETRAALLNAPFAVIMPDGKLGWWVDSEAPGGGRYASFIGEVLADAEARFGVGGARELRGICGWSMGGFGAVRYAEEHPRVFAAAAAIIGLLDFPNPAYPPEWNHAVPPVLGGSGNRFNPLLKAARLRGLRILLVAADRAFDYRMNETFHQRLERERIPHRYIVLKGEGHTFSAVRKGLRLVLDFFRETLSPESSKDLAP